MEFVLKRWIGLAEDDPGIARFTSDRVVFAELIERDGAVSRRQVSRLAKMSVISDQVIDCGHGLIEHFLMGLRTVIKIKFGEVWRGEQAVDLESVIGIEEFTEFSIKRCCAVNFTFKGISGDMGSGDISQFEQLEIKGRFVFPDIENDRADCSGLDSGFERLVVHDRAPGGVDQNRAGF